MTGCLVAIAAYGTTMGLMFVSPWVSVGFAVVFFVGAMALNVWF